MSREIKFRAYIGGTMKQVDVMAITNCRWNCPEWNCPEFEKTGVSLVYQPHIKVMQYTGLKDKNGKDIYEGDIITPTAYKNTDSKEWIKFKCEVILYKGMFCLKLNKSFITEYKPLYKSLEDAASANNRFEIIGNIYENPELLKNPDSDTIPTSTSQSCQNH
jgi:uncharacterized phage protein (TIGR01671 family)